MADQDPALARFSQNFNNDLNTSFADKFRKNILGQKLPAQPAPAAPAAPANPWVGVAQQQVAPVDPMAAVAQAAQVPQAEPVEQAAAAPNPQAMQASAAKRAQSGEFGTGPDAMLQALAAEGSTWAKAQLAKRQTK